MAKAPRKPLTYDLGEGFDEPATPPAVSLLFASATGTAPPPGEIALDRLLNNPYQPADRGEPQAVSELAAVIERQGFHGQLLARPAQGRPGYYELAFGHQRREAATQAGLTHVPVKVEDLSDREMAEQVVTENIHRQDLTDYQEAQTYRVMKTALGMTDDEIARAVGKVRAYVTQRLGLLKAPDDVQELVRDMPGSFSAALHLKQVEDPDLRGELITGFREGKLTTHDIAQARRNPLPPAPVVPPTATEPRALAPTRPVAAAQDPDEAAARARLLKLSTAAESLTRWAEQADESPIKITNREYVRLCEIRDQVTALIEHHRPVLES